MKKLLAFKAANRSIAVYCDGALHVATRHTCSILFSYCEGQYYKPHLLTYYIPTCIGGESVVCKDAIVKSAHESYHYL